MSAVYDYILSDPGDRNYITNSGLRDIPRQKLNRSRHQVGVTKSQPDTDSDTDTVTDIKLELEGWLNNISPDLVECMSTIVE